MAKEILILAQNEEQRGINFLYGLLIPSIPRVVQGELLPHTPSSTLPNFIHFLEEDDLQALDNGELIWRTSNVFMPGPLNIKDLEVVLQVRYRSEAPKIRKMFESVGETVGMRFSAEPERSRG